MLAEALDENADDVGEMRLAGSGKTGSGTAVVWRTWGEKKNGLMKELVRKPLKVK